MSTNQRCEELIERIEAACERVASPGFTFRAGLLTAVLPVLYNEATPEGRAQIEGLVETFLGPVADQLAAQENELQLCIKQLKEAWSEEKQ